MTYPEADIIVQNGTPAPDPNIGLANCHILRPKRLTKPMFSRFHRRPRPKEPSKDVTAKLSIEVVTTLACTFVKLLALTAVVILNLFLGRLSESTSSSRNTDIRITLLVGWKGFLLAAGRAAYIVPLALSFWLFRASFNLACQVIGIRSRQGQRRGTRRLRHD
jgi:hypothetical protein